jgi:hydrogenase nickel incorporation protein HypA/HybF
MHELSLMESVVEAIVERIGDARVTVVRLEVGELSAVIPGSLHFCFDICTRGTPLEGSDLEIATIPGRGRCERCGVDRRIRTHADMCECGGYLRVLAGEELRVKNVEVA